MSGKTFKDAEPILAKDAIKVQEDIINKINSIIPSTIIKIGSVGKKNDNEYHGDIDLAIKVDTYEDLCNLIDNVFPDNLAFKHKGKSIYVYSILYKYISDIDNKEHNVQVDFMMVHNEEYAKFRYYCPDFKNNESKYKVYCRILLWHTILNACPDEDLPKELSRKFLLYPTGLYIEVFEKDNIFNFSKDLYTDDVNEIIHIPFTDNVKPEDILTVEKMWDYLHSNNFKYPEVLKDIEMHYFTIAYKKPWEDINLNPEDFKLVYWTPDQIKEECKKYDEINAINMQLNKIQKVKG